MSQIFHRSANTLARVTIFGAVFVLAALTWVGYGIQSSPYVTYAGVRKPQPVPFSHQHHVSGLGIDCRYCHTSVEVSSFAGIPPTLGLLDIRGGDSVNSEAVLEGYLKAAGLDFTGAGGNAAPLADSPMQYVAIGHSRNCMVS